MEVVDGAGVGCWWFRVQVAALMVDGAAVVLDDGWMDGDNEVVQQQLVVGGAVGAGARRHAVLAVAVAGGGEGVGGERWRCQAQRRSMVAARDLIPSSDLPVLFFCPSTSLLSSQDDPSNFSLAPLVTSFLHGRVPP